MEGGLVVRVAKAGKKKAPSLAGQWGKDKRHMDFTRDQGGMLSLDHLLELVRLGYWVFPIKKNSKGPLTKDEDGADYWLAPSGVHSASSDPAQIQKWWKELPGNNWGLACGRGMVALDRDLYKNPNWPESETEKADLENHPFAAKSARGGQHLFFRLPPEKEWGNWNGKIAAGVDFKKDGGYVVLAGSSTPDGAYGWLPGRELNVSPAQLPDLPAWLVFLLDGLVAKPKVEATSLSAVVQPAPGNLADRIRSYLAKVPHHDGTGASGGHRAILNAGRAIARFGIRDESGLAYLSEWNSRSTHKDGPESERQLRHKWKAALAYMNGRPSDLLERASSTNFAEDTHWEEFLSVQGNSERAEIRMRAGDVAQVSDEIAQVLSSPGRCVPIFRFGKDVVHVVQEDVSRVVAGEEGELIRQGSRDRAVISRLNETRAGDYVSRNCLTMKGRATKSGEIEWTPANTDPAILRNLAAIPERWPIIRRLSQGPVYLWESDRLINVPGMDDESRIYIANSLPGFAVEELVTPAAALEAVRRLLDLVQDFPFESEKDKAKWLIDLVATVVAPAKMPLSAYRAPQRGTGKSYLAKMPSIIVHGQEPRIFGWPVAQDGGTAEPEMEKLLASLAAGGESVVLFDNLHRGSFGSIHIDRFLTEPNFFMRTLGKNEAGAQTGGPACAKIICTGNNIDPASDSIERVMVICLAPTTERRRSKASSEFTIGNALEYCRRNQAEILGNVVRLVRGYRQFLESGGERPKGEAWSAFELWVHHCVDPVRWALGFDPLEGLAASWSKDDAETQSLADFLREFARVSTEHSGSSTSLELTATEALELASDTAERCEAGRRFRFDRRFGNAIRGILNERRGGSLAGISSDALGRDLAKWKDTPADVDGVFYRMAAKMVNGRKRYHLIQCGTSKAESSRTSGLVDLLTYRSTLNEEYYSICERRDKSPTSPSSPPEPTEAKTIAQAGAIGETCAEVVYSATAPNKNFTSVDVGSNRSNTCHTLAPSGSNPNAEDVNPFPVVTDALLRELGL